jgi:hypothetical protein
LVPWIFVRPKRAEHLVENCCQRILFVIRISPFWSPIKRTTLAAPFTTGWWRWGWFRIIQEFHHPPIGAGIGTAAKHDLVLNQKDNGIIRRQLLIEFPEFREQRAKVTVQPARELRLIRLVKLVEHPSRIFQVAQRLLIRFLDFLPDARAIRWHHRAAAVDRLGIGNGMTLCLLSGSAALH